MNHTGVANIDQATSRPLVLWRLLSRASQNAILPFFESLLKCVCFCLITVLFDYHWTQILCEVEEQATYMPMSPGCLSPYLLYKITKWYTVRTLGPCTGRALAHGLQANLARGPDRDDILQVQVLDPNLELHGPYIHLVPSASTDTSHQVWILLLQ